MFDGGPPRRSNGGDGGSSPLAPVRNGLRPGFPRKRVAATTRSDRLDTTPSGILADVLRGDAEALSGLLREALEALVGAPVRLAPLRAGHPELGARFGTRELFLFPCEDAEGEVLPMFLALDLPAAVATGGAFALMSPAQTRAVLASGEVPGALREAIGEVAGIVMRTIARLVRARAPRGTATFARGTQVRRLAPGPWPALVGVAGPARAWDVLGFGLTIDDAECGSLLLAASAGDGREGPIRPIPGTDLETTEIPQDDDTIDGSGRIGRPGAAPPVPATECGAAPQAIPPGVRVEIAGDPSDRATATLRATLAEAGCSVLPLGSAGRAGLQASVVFVVSRSSIDLRSRLEAASALRRPALVVACSDRPTIELVRTARAGAADSFLVLPADRSRLGSLFQRLVEVATP
jgi:hypothetical protein